MAYRFLVTFHFGASLPIPLWITAADRTAAKARVERMGYVILEGPWVNR